MKPMSIANYSIILLLIAMMGCEGINEYKNMTEAERKMAALGISPERHETMKLRTEARRYIESILYVGMPEEEFLRALDRESPNSRYKLSISKHNGNQYTVIEFAPTNSKVRITFQDGLLSKFERCGTSSNPFGYAERTFMLSSNGRYWAFSDDTIVDLQKEKNG